MSNPDLMPLVTTDELVAVAWIATIPGVGPGIVATTLPPDTDRDGKPAEWVVRGDGFVTVTVVGGTPDPMLPVHRPVFQVDTWAVLPGSGRPPWGIASNLAETIVQAAIDRTRPPRLLEITVKGKRYPDATVDAATVLQSPRRVPDDPGDYARYMFDLQLQWKTVGEVLR